MISKTSTATEIDREREKKMDAAEKSPFDQNMENIVVFVYQMKVTHLNHDQFTATSQTNCTQ